MAIIFQESDPQLWDKLKTRNLQKEVFVLPTDTVLGFSCALSHSLGIEKIRRLKQNPQARFIALVKDIDQAQELAELSAAQRKVLERNWPGPISFVLPIDQNRTIALRCPKDDFLQHFLSLMGEPIISTSCNLHNDPVCQSAEEARDWFGDAVDFYVEGSLRKTNVASTLVDLSTPTPQILRAGAVSPSL